MIRIKVLLIFFSLLTLTGCLKDDSNPKPEQYLDIGDVIAVESGLLLKVTQDVILFDPEFKTDENVSVGDRLMILFEVIEATEVNPNYNFLITVKEFLDVPVKDFFIVDDTNRDTLLQEPVLINSLGTKDHYLNIDFSYYGNEENHYFELAYDTANQVEGKYVFDFLHIARDYIYNYTYRNIYSFDLSNFNWDEGEEPYEIVFRYKGYDNSLEELELSYTPPAE